MFRSCLCAKSAANMGLESLLVTVVGLDGSVLLDKVELTPAETIRDIVKKVEKELGMAQTADLIANGVTLLQHWGVLDSGLVDGSIITAILKPREAPTIEIMGTVVHMGSCKECHNRPSFNVPTETKALYCAVHRKKGMVNVVCGRPVPPGWDF